MPASWVESITARSAFSSITVPRKGTPCSIGGCSCRQTGRRIDKAQEAGIPETVVFRTKPELGLEMVQAAATAGVRFRWVGGDSIYGDSPDSCKVCGHWANGMWWTRSADARVWTSEPTLRPVGRIAAKADQPPKQPKAIEKPITIVQAVAAVADSAWKRSLWPRAVKGRDL